MDPVLAYIDPGSGSLIIQALIAGLVAAPIFFRKQISRFVRTVRGEHESIEPKAAPEDATKGS